MRAASVGYRRLAQANDAPGFELFLAQAVCGIGRNHDRFNRELAETVREQGAPRVVQANQGGAGSGFAGEGGKGAEWT